MLDSWLFTEPPAEVVRASDNGNDGARIQSFPNVCEESGTVMYDENFVHKLSCVFGAMVVNLILHVVQRLRDHMVYYFSHVLTPQTILVGDSGVGKTSFLVQFDTGKFQHGCFAATVGIGFTTKTVLIPDGSVRLQIWDTAGQERFRSITHAYYRDAHALLLLYDVTNKSSFNNIRAWLAEINEYALDDAVIVLIGNKADMISSRVVRREDGERLADEFSVNFMETSAKSGLNVTQAFQVVASHLRHKQYFPRPHLINITEAAGPEKYSWRCCGT